MLLAMMFICSCSNNKEGTNKIFVQTKIEYDYDNDSVIDRVESYAYDVYGKMIKEEIDRNNDTNIDSVEYYTYDAKGTGP